MMRVTFERQRFGWTKATLARAAQLDQGLVSKIESRRVRPYEKELRRLAAALGWPEDEAGRLLEDVEEHGTGKA